ncbi:MAG: MFS transporter [Proteobacteria bacterium]|nr:MFS transporter [Pseudomonadota bacterium]
MFFWLAGWVLVCRVGMTFFRVPHFALGADMADTPNAKTTNVAFRQFFHVLGGILVFWIARELMVPTPEFPIAQTNPEHYPLLSLICAVSALLAMLIATVGTYGVALATVKPNESSDAGHGSLTRLAIDFKHTLRPRAFRQLVICIGAFAIAAGIQRATELYLASYFWGLTTSRAMLLPIATLVGSLVGIVFWTLISRRIEKRSCYIGGVLTYAIVAIALPAANVLGVLPPTEADAFAMIVIGGTVLAGLLAAAPTVLVGAMIADVIDADERNSGRRRAASFFATAAFVAKPALALSLLLAGALLAGAGVSSDELPSQNVSTILGLAVGSTITFLLLSPPY